MKYLVSCLSVLLCACASDGVGPVTKCVSSADSATVVNAIVTLQATGDTLSAEWVICYEHYTYLLPQAVNGDTLSG